MIKRSLENSLKTSIAEKAKVVVLLGARQVGKTTLVKKIYGELNGKKLALNGDFIDDQQRLKPDRATLSGLLSHLDYIFIDEAQNIEHIGTTLKLIHDEFPGLGIIATGSSSFDLTESTGEPLTGRQKRFVLYPISFAEQRPKPTTQNQIISHAMIYGSYPEVLGIAAPEDKISHLKQLTADYLLKDLYSQVDLNRVKLLDLLRLLAFQIGSEVSYNELASSVQLDVKTVAKYVLFLERAFVLVRLGGFSRNLRKEVSKSQKIYFYDLGIRNAIINAFNGLELRSDLGALWENFLIIERIKRQAYLNAHSQHYFWRTYDQKEIDLVEETFDKLAAYEFKFKGRESKIPKLWFEAYPDSSTAIITPENVTEFLLGS